MLTRDFDAELAKLATVPMSPILRPYQREANLGDRSGAG